jgi:hypothetical protein
MSQKNTSQKPRPGTVWLLRGLGVLLCMLLVCSNSIAQSGLITFEESMWSSVIGTKLYHGGPSNTLTDASLGVSFIVAYGEMVVTSMGVGLNSLFFSPYITSNSTMDVSGMVVIRFTNAKEHVSLKVSHDEHPAHTPDYMKVSFYGSTGATNLLYSENIPWNSGAYSVVSYDNASTGIREVVVNSMYMENTLDNLEFTQLGTAYSFDNGTVQGWTIQGAYDNLGAGPFSSHFVSMWKDDIDFPSPPGQAVAGDSHGSFYLGCANGHGVTGSGGTWWIMQMHSPDLSSASAWQTAKGYSVEIANCMGPSAVYANLYVKVYDYDQTRNRWFYSGAAQQLVHDVYGDATATWNSLVFDWSGIGSFPTDYTLVEVFVDIWGTLAGTYEGGVALDAVTPFYDTPVPIQLAGLDVHAISDQQVLLTWKTLSEINNSGFEVQRKGIGDPAFVSLEGAFVPGNGTTLVQHDYTYIDKSVTPGTWLYRLKQIDMDGTVSYSKAVQVSVATTGFERETLPPTAFGLMQNYPNPFNPVTSIGYTIGVVSRVRLAVYDLLGQQVAILVDEMKEPGTYTATFDGTGLASGLYVYKLISGGFSESRKMVLVQ